MLKENYQEKMDNLTAQNRLQKFFIIVIGISIVIAAYYVTQTVKNEKVIIQYPDGTNVIEVQGQRANVDYIERFAQYVIFLKFNYTAFNFGGQAESLLKITSSRYFPKLKKNLLELQNTVDEFNISSAFYPRNLKLDPDEKTIKVEGLLFESAHGTSMLGDRGEQKTYILKYTIGNGGLLLDGIQEKV